MKFRSSFVCSNCGYKSISYLGKCPECGEWNSLVEQVDEEIKNQKSKIKIGGNYKKPVRISEIKEERVGRMSTGFSEVDRVLGGGMVAGSVILIAGEPGVGKSTLLLQIARTLTSSKLKIKSEKLEKNESDNKKHGNTETRKGTGVTENIVLYVSGEESEAQIKIRFDRLSEDEKHGNTETRNSKRGTEKNSNEAIGQLSNDGLLVLNETNVDIIAKVVEEIKPTLLIVDSVQTIYTEDLSGTAGSVGQVRESAFRLSNVCKGLGIPLFLVGQITKEGQIAGPKVLEHLVDVVLYFEGEHFQNLRILRGVKNRFGAVDEAGIFEMGDVGLLEVKNPSQLFLGGPFDSSLDSRSGLAQGDNSTLAKRSGAVVTCTLEGTRPILAEIQALTVFTSLSIPRRVFSGLDFNRCQVVLAVLQKYLNIDFSHLDVYLSVSGGLKIKEPAADLAVALSLVSSVRGISFDAVCYGEIGLLGDIRRVNNMQLRKKECQRLGYKKIMSSEEMGNIRDVLKK